MPSGSNPSFSSTRADAGLSIKCEPSRLVKASVRDAKDVTGRVLEADGSGVTFDVDGTKRTVPYDALGAGSGAVVKLSAGGAA